jgi:hypothetical protein
VLLGGCAAPRQVRHLDPHGVFAFSSASEITNAFKAVSSVLPFDYIKTPHTEYLFVTVGGPFGGARIFEVFCYEHTEHDIWRERGMVFVTYSPIMRPQFVPHGDTVDLVHEGEVLFTFGSAGAQERRNRQPRVGRANKRLEPTRLTPSVCSCAAGRAAQAQRSAERR